MKTRYVVLMTACALIVACVNDGPHKPVTAGAAGGGSGGAGQSAAGGTPGYAQVSAVFKKNCSACHPSKQPADWLDFSTAKRYADNGVLVKRVVVERSMPDRGSPQAAAMTEAERQVIAAWVAGGAPREPGAAAPVAGGGVADGGTAGPAASAPAAPVAIQSCTSCHGTPPAGPGDASTPRLNGQNETYLAYQLSLFARTDRIHVNGPMNKIAADMSTEQINAAAKAYAVGGAMNDDAMAVPAERRARFDRGEKLAIESCSMCHASNEMGGRPNHPMIPVLVGQNERYIRDALNAYRSGWRKNQEMNEYASELKDGDIDALGYYYANVRLRPRPAR